MRRDTKCRAAEEDEKDIGEWTSSNPGYITVYVPEMHIYHLKHLYGEVAVTGTAVTICSLEKKGPIKLGMVVVTKVPVK